ncbi:acetate kinase [Crocosphaera subtropica]|uniref:acetate kinase n=1 Tax=Crocosphaera subtropica TaxID=2546360 RepID=UPI000466EF05|nr:acetate kinase [Crocosphaera subtropica]
MNILVLNAGSSSQKSCLYCLDEKELPQETQKPIWSANIDWTATSNQGVFNVKANGIKQHLTLESNDHHQGIRQMLDTLIQGKTKVIDNFSAINLVGHRVVHGGTNYSEATLINSDVKATITELIPLAPTHNPAHLEGIEIIESILNNIPQVAVFDTAFHSQMPLENAAYPIPYQWLEKGIRRYGFHGISHQYCANRVAELMNQPLSSLKLITCHLGNGCSLAAIKNGISIDTTMGFTPLEGLMMGTRGGSIDPAILIYLMREHNFQAEELNHLLNQESGLKGISGISSDMRAICQGIKEGNQRAKLAFDMFIHRLHSCLGSMLTSLGGLDALVFTAGIGENSTIVREKACEALSFLGLELDLFKNNDSPVGVDISSSDSSIKVFVIQTQEDWAIAQSSWQLYNSLSH